jgi:hypothetical protein
VVQLDHGIVPCYPKVYKSGLFRYNRSESYLDGCKTLKSQNKLSGLLSKFLDTFFHLPTLITLALIAVVMLWRIVDADLHIGQGYIRLHTNRGNMTLDWADGCCDLDW